MDVCTDPHAGTDFSFVCYEKPFRFDTSWLLVWGFFKHCFLNLFCILQVFLSSLCWLSLQCFSSLSASIQKCGHSAHICAPVVPLYIMGRK